MQTSVDSESHLIYSYQVTSQNTDQGLLHAICTESKENLGADVLQVVADKGYESREDILACLLDGNIPHVALKYDRESRVFHLPYIEAQIHEAVQMSTKPADIQRCLYAGILPSAYKGKGLQIVVQSRTVLSCFLRREDGTVSCPTGQILTPVKKRGPKGIIYKNKDACR